MRTTLPEVRIVGSGRDKFIVKQYDDNNTFLRTLTEPTTLNKANTFAKVFALTNGLDWISPDPTA